ncbi:glycoside hydrolase domain-containing protein [Aggregatilinea lenta]|uniref:glycoside hydrolase domain-containing protein n=1 Tax=Aggregatilinea lenta TaxID=913108 RepID=UPI000E5A997C|nr:glycoside hydrolase domain-containing protein [Aggregatilinea lenta]
MLRFFCRCLCLLLGLLALGEPSDAYGLKHASVEPVVWTVDAMERIRPNDLPGETNAITLHAARGEYEAFQIGVHASEGNLTGVSLIVSDLVSADGTRIPSSSITLYREHYVYVEQASPT